MSDNAGRKDDAEKPKVELLSARWLLGVGSVLSFGAKKYAAHNWRKGIARSRLLGAGLRHIFAYLGGEDNDAESGLSHLHHASCCLMFASELHETRPDLDDRWKPEPPKCAHKDVATDSPSAIHGRCEDCGATVTRRGQQGEVFAKTEECEHSTLFDVVYVAKDGAARRQCLNCGKKRAVNP